MFSVNELGDYVSVYHEAYRKMQVSSSIPDESAYTPFFDAPFLYWVNRDGIYRVRVEESGQRRTAETVVEEPIDLLTAAPVTARIPVHGSANENEGNSHNVVTQTHVALPLQGRLALLALDRYHQASKDSPLYYVDVPTESRLHTPVFDPESSTWIVVSEDGAVLRLKASPVGTSSPVAERVNSPKQLVSRDTVKVGQPRSVGRCVFAAYWGEENGQSGIVRFDLDADTLSHFAPDHVSLSRDGGLEQAPLAFNDEGVVHPGADHDQALFVPVEGSRERALGLDGIDRFYHRHVVVIDDRYVAWIPSPSGEAGTSLAEIDVNLQSRHIRGEVRLSLDDVSWSEVVALRHVASAGDGPACLLGQTRDALLYVYPKKKDDV